MTTKKAHQPAMTLNKPSADKLNGFKSPQAFKYL